MAKKVCSDSSLLPAYHCVMKRLLSVTLPDCKLDDAIHWGWRLSPLLLARFQQGVDFGCSEGKHSCPEDWVQSRQRASCHGGLWGIPPVPQGTTATSFSRIYWLTSYRNGRHRHGMESCGANQRFKLKVTLKRCKMNWSLWESHIHRNQLLLCKPDPKLSSSSFHFDCFKY